MVQTYNNILQPIKTINETTWTFIWDILESPVMSASFIIAAFFIYLWINTVITLRKGEFAMKIYSKEWWKITILKMLHIFSRTLISITGIELAIDEIDFLEVIGASTLAAIITFINSITSYEEKELNNDGSSN